MGQFYEVQFTKRLDGTDNFGNVTDSIKFTTEGETVLFKHQPKTVVEQGTKLYGRIEQLTSRNGKPYRVFKREQQDQAMGATNGYGAQARSAATQSQGPKGSSPLDSRGDGMRQGMCINNATLLINQFATEAITPERWAEGVFKYAQALYNKGDLNTKPTQQQDTVYVPSEEELNGHVDLSAVDAILGPVQTAVPANR